jgi:ATP-binding cassette subfamily F protein 3
VLDEPTNHLDLASKEVLKQALQRFDGTMLVVSHDRDFLNGLTNIVYEIKPDRLKIWQGDVLDFLKEKKAESIAAFERAKVEKKAVQEELKVKPSEHSVPEMTREQQKEIEKQQKKLQSQQQKIEQEISKKEEELKKLEAEVAALDYSDVSQSEKVLEAYAKAKSELEGLYEKWMG